MAAHDPAGATSTYIDFDYIASDDFSPYNHANNLVLATNNPSDPTIDLTTPLSRVLFDLQEIDSHIHTLTSRSALDILSYTSAQNAAAQRILARVDEERARVSTSYERLEKEVLVRHQRAVEARTTAQRSLEVMRLGRSVQRILNVARQFEMVVAESGLGSAVRPGKEDHGALLRASLSILAFRDAISGKDGAQLGRVNVVKTLRGRVFEDGEARILESARRVAREFSMSTLAAGPATSGTTSGPTFREAEDSRARFTSAVRILYLLSPSPRIDGEKMLQKDFESEYLLRALQGYLQTAITSSSASIGRALGQLPMLDRALLEASARCQNVVALEALLRGIHAPEHPLLRYEKDHGRTKEAVNHADIDIDDDDNDGFSDTKTSGSETFLSLLLSALDTASLPSYFWRSLASSLSSRVTEILNRGGISARTLRSQRDTVRTEIRGCVLRGSRLPRTVALGDSRASSTGEEPVENWEREAAVMVGSVVGLLGR
ncbi:Conserved oligomeric Golgi complex subunit [Elasticomyces elasticus]|uniref:Conserved oligomeric Golgi complex subunit 5 n=1 Tax=Exophiala sideris TaxID=1016849 RepID=A0ABR0JCU3_9EURO|nr:Conserved oligomeric Golgi complex subunit [Elasticomyces elasticus]KAK5031309.1 Conserved oligomeric Golgi complex subunit [Exophiala sideris]KAK5039029.1 Conserved oligomeric Golgi complex subunit [Exophiala sideris]KAK5060914.1 Conserved oligomeric Golgi complex subunit [Exophiala sideris]KAK5183825.1 Conserved oligomeric Golgi complex subunit [Eurotiomycetes sp. CCFEE 6388]